MTAEMGFGDKLRKFLFGTARDIDGFITKANKRSTTNGTIITLKGDGIYVTTKDEKVGLQLKRTGQPSLLSTILSIPFDGMIKNPVEENIMGEFHHIRSEMEARETANSMIDIKRIESLNDYLKNNGFKTTINCGNIDFEESLKYANSCNLFGGISRYSHKIVKGELKGCKYYAMFGRPPTFCWCNESKFLDVTDAYNLEYGGGIPEEHRCVGGNNCDNNKWKPGSIYWNDGGY